MIIWQRKYPLAALPARLLPLQRVFYTQAHSELLEKPRQPGKWRLILDLSSPAGHSVNDGIPKDDFSVHYVTVDMAIQALLSLGPGALMAKFDVKAAYRNIAIHPDDRYLLGMRWRGSFFVDLVLPFGLRSAPFIFDAVASAVDWILSHNHGVHPLLHYLDDFLTMGPPASSTCQDHVDRAFAVFNRLGLPLHPEKCEGPSTTLTFLGIELDSVNQVARLPMYKVDRIRHLLVDWSHKVTCSRRELESLIGSLHHACRVVLPGRSFLRRMIDLLQCFRNPHHPIRLNLEFRRHLHWRLEFFVQWNGWSFFLTPSANPLPDLFVASDASGGLGFGACWHSNWFFNSWSFLPHPVSIAFTEFVPIVVAAYLWGSAWFRLRVQFECDNSSVVAVLQRGSSKSPEVMHLMRILVSLACTHNFSFTAVHVPGHTNLAADALSRLQVAKFRRLAPESAPLPTSIPPMFLSRLIPPTS